MVMMTTKIYQFHNAQRYTPDQIYIEIQSRHGTFWYVSTLFSSVAYVKTLGVETDFTRGN